MQVLGIDSAVQYKGSHHTVTALENKGNGNVTVVLMNDKNKVVRLKHTEVENLLDKGELCVSYVSSSRTNVAERASASRRQKKR